MWFQTDLYVHLNKPTINGEDQNYLPAFFFGAVLAAAVMTINKQNIKQKNPGKEN